MNWSPTTSPLPPRTGLSQDALIDLVHAIRQEDPHVELETIDGLGPDAYSASMFDYSEGRALTISTAMSWPAYRRTRAQQQEARRTHSRYGAVCDV